MRMLVHNVFVPSTTRVGHSESVPRWSLVSRLALGFLGVAIPALLFTLAALAASADDATYVDLLAAAFGTWIGHFILTMIYVSFALQNPRVGPAKWAWVIGMLCAAPIALPLYWWVHIWNAPIIGDSRVDEDVPQRVEGDQG
jgi:hypothetical protein